MTHDQSPQLDAQPEQNEPVLLVGMLLVRTEQRIFVEEHGPGLVESHAVLSAVDRRLSLVPFEPKSFQAYTRVPTS